MAKNRIEICESMKNDIYNLTWHISALTKNRYRISIVSQTRGVIDENTYSGPYFEQCISMRQTVSDEGEQIFLEIENDSTELEIFDDIKFEGNGEGISACYFCRGADQANYHEACILFWAVKKKTEGNTAPALTKGNSVPSSFPLRNFAGLNCISYFFCINSPLKISVKLWEETDDDKQLNYVEDTYEFSNKEIHLITGSILTQKKCAYLQISAEGTHQIITYCDSSIIAGSTQSLVHYHVKSYDDTEKSLPFSMDLIGWNEAFG